jgi:hypothetical protein
MLAGLALVLTSAGCGADASPTTPGPRAAEAGRACQVIEFDVVNPILGTAFDAAGGAQVERTYACTLTQTGLELPRLTFTITASTMDVLLYTALVRPEGVTDIPDLGRYAYEVSGPERLEIHWLSQQPHIAALRYALPAGASPETIRPQLVEVARGVEQAIVAASS